MPKIAYLTPNKEGRGPKKIMVKAKRAVKEKKRRALKHRKRVKM